MYIEIKKKSDNVINFPQGDQITDRNGNPITRPEVIAEYKRIKAIPHKERTAKEGIRLNNILKHGDKSPNKNKMRQANNMPRKPKTKTPSLAELNNTPDQNAPINIIAQVTDAIYNGINPIQACINLNIKPRKFYEELEKSQNLSLKNEYYHARECYAEFCLHRRELLELQLLSGEIDSSTYRTLADDYKFLASKFYPKVYGDKINIESNVATTVTHTVDNERIMQLNQMLSGGLLEDKRAVDAEFEELD